MKAFLLGFFLAAPALAQFGATPVLMYDSSGNAYPSGAGSPPAQPVNTNVTCYTNVTGVTLPCNFSGGGSTTNPLTGAASGGAAPGSTFNGGSAVTFDYHTLGAFPLAGGAALTGATGGNPNAGGINATQYLLNGVQGEVVTNPSAIAATLPNQIAYAFNVSPFLMPHWTSCVSRVKINAGNCRVIMVGDSTTYGLGSNGTLSTGDMTTAAYPARLSQYLNSALLPTQRDAVIGAGGGAGNGDSCLNDNRIVCGGGWGVNATFFTAGGDTFLATSAGTLTFTPTDQVDTFVFWYLSNGFGAGTYAVDGGSTTSFSEAGSAGLHSVTISAGTLGSHALDIAWTSGSVYVVGFEAYNSAQGSVLIENAGWSGSRSQTWDSGSSLPYLPQPTITNMAPDVVVLDLGINDWSLPTSVPNYTTFMQSLITSWQAVSDVVLVTPAPSSTGFVSLATQQPYIAALYQLATTNNIPLIDNFSRWGSYERANPAPMSFYFNNVHPNKTGYVDFAQSVAQQMLLPVSYGGGNGTGTGMVYPAAGVSLSTGSAWATSLPYAATTGLLYDAAGTLSFSATLPAAAFPALTGDCTTVAGALATTCLNTNGVPFTTAATTAIGTSGATIPLLSGGNTYSGISIHTINGAASTPIETWTGTLATGNATTSFPGLYYNCSGSTARTNFNTNGTALGINTCSGFTGNLFDFGVNGGQVANLTSQGQLVLQNILNSNGVEVPSGAYYGFSSTTSNAGTKDTVLCRLGAAGVAGVESAATCTNTVAGATGTFVAAAYNTATNCSSTASPAVCGSAAAGSVLIPTGTTSSTLTVNTTAVTANSQIFFYPDDSLGTKLSATCNSTAATLVGGSFISARTAGTSFTITFNGTIATNGVCGSFEIKN